MQNQQLSPDLPITKHLPNILALISQHPVTVVSGKTGCGKSTQVPKTIWKADDSVKIAVCQPRRVAATSLAVRVAQEVGCKLGSKVGYHIGLESFKSQNCSIIYMTYGILIQELLFQGEVPYTHIVLDEIHQRSLEMDFTFIALKNLLNNKIKQGKKTAKLVIMSATLNSQEFAYYFSTEPQSGLFFVPSVTVIQGERRQQNTRGGRRNKAPVEQNFKLSEMPSKYVQAATYDIPQQTRFKIQQKFWQKKDLYDSIQEQPRLNDSLANEAVSIIKKMQTQHMQGDILIFLPGFFEIQFVKKKLLEAELSEERIVEVHSVFSEELYEKLFESKTKNKLILATNIGESSITLPFCKVVIDFCLTKRNTLKQKGITQLQTKFASKASMTQRAGRVGRVADGTVYRMITKQFYDQLPQYEEPEIKCISLEMVILRAKQLDLINNSKVFSDPYQFLLGVMSPPKVQTIRHSIQHLIQQQALNGGGPNIAEASKLQLTKIGQFMVSMPCDLQISKMIMMGIKLRIPNLIISVASIMMATKMFFAHEQRRSNIQQFLHAIIGYDNKLSNDFLLREKMYNHWKQKFYYPAKEKKFYNRRAKNAHHHQTEGSLSKRIYQAKSDEEQDELFSFLQQFSQEKWSQHEKDFCFPRGMSLNTLRQIVKIEENLKFRMKEMGVVFSEKQSNFYALFMLCLAYAYPHNDCEINYSKYIQNRKNELNFVELPAHWNITDKQIEDYIYPQKQYRIQQKDKSTIIIQAPPNVLKKFIFPQYFHKNSITKSVSPLFVNLAKQKVFNKFQTDVMHQFYLARVLNESINRVLIPPDYKNKYRLLTNQISLSGNTKMIKMSALVQEEAYLMMQLITDKEAEVALHPSGQMLSSFKVRGHVYPFKRVITEKELEVVRRLRTGAIRKNTNQINSNEEVMSIQEIQILNKFLQSNEIQTHEPQVWEDLFVKIRYGDGKSEFHPISYPFKLQPQLTYFQEYNRWKRQRYESFIKNYRAMLLDQAYIICSQCQHIEPIERASMYNPIEKTLQLNEYSGSWEREQNMLFCPQKHQVGKVKNQEEGILFREKVRIYIPFNHYEPFWKEWPSKEELKELNEQGKRETMRAREQLEVFECPFCFKKDEQFNSVVITKQNPGQNFWKRLQQHFGSYQHSQGLSNFKKSLRQQSAHK